MYTPAPLYINFRMSKSATSVTHNNVGIRSRGIKWGSKLCSEARPKNFPWKRGKIR